MTEREALIMAESALEAVTKLLYCVETCFSGCVHYRFADPGQHETAEKCLYALNAIRVARAEAEREATR